MRKGFTLIELLIVMVVVGILVTVALPTYKTAMEKGRGLEGVANAAAVSEAVNAYYVRNGNSYGTLDELTAFALGSGDDGVAGTTKSKYFDAPQISLSDSTVTVSVERPLSSKSYTIEFVSANGAVSSRSCSGYAKYCKAIGF